MDERSKGIYGPNPGEPYPLPPLAFEYLPFIEATAYVRDAENDRSFDIKVSGSSAAKVAAALNEVLAAVNVEGK